jgi:hypothetical protein
MRTSPPKCRLPRLRRIPKAAEFYLRLWADYSLILGGLIHGVLIVQPDFPELKDVWSLLCHEN